MPSISQLRAPAGRRRRTTSLCIALALSAAHEPVPAATVTEAVPSGTINVTSCDDAGPGTLRDTLAAAVDHDEVFFGNLTCSTITLTTGALATAADNISVFGSTAITVTANGNSQVLVHSGHGVLRIDNAVFADGDEEATTYAQGGCVYSSGSVAMTNSTIRNCHARSTGTFAPFAAGGGVFAHDALYLTSSSVTDNELTGAAVSYSAAVGGGVYSFGPIHIDRSVISRNTVDGGACCYTNGGGVATRSSLQLRYSEISDNEAFTGGGAYFGSNGDLSTIESSTISGNHAASGPGGVRSWDTLLIVRNSTIAFNSSDTLNVFGGGLAVGQAGGYLVLRSSIISNNTAGGSPADICCVLPGRVLGASNMVTSYFGSIPPDTIVGDPELSPLAAHGGPTRTHAISPNSLARDAGSVYANTSYDQRGPGFARTVGIRQDIGAYELQSSAPPDTIFENGFDP